MRALFLTVLLGLPGLGLGQEVLPYSEPALPVPMPARPGRCWDVGGRTNLHSGVRLDFSGGTSSHGSGSGSGGSGATVHGATPVGSGGGSSGSSSGGLSLGSGGGGGDGAAILVAAVVVVAALPLVLYAFDDPVGGAALAQYECPSFSLSWMGGTQAGTGLPDSQLNLAARVGFAWSVLGVDYDFTRAALGVSTQASHVVLRAEPREHVEVGLAFGVRSLTGGGLRREGVEVGVPHRYVFKRDGLRTVGLELRPMLTFGPSGIDASLEAAFVFPVVEFVHLRAGGRVFSFGASTFYGFDAGLALAL